MANVKKPPREVEELSTREYYKILVKLYQILKVKGAGIKKLSHLSVGEITYNSLESTYNITPNAFDNIMYHIDYLRASYNLDLYYDNYPPRFKKIRFGFVTAAGEVAHKARKKFNVLFIPHLPKLVHHNIWLIGKSPDNMITFYKGDFPLGSLDTQDLTTMKPGRFFSKYLKLHPSEVQELTENFNQAFVEPELEMEIKLLTEAEDISWAYAEENYTNLYSGDCLGNSCMRYSEFSEVVQHYARIGAGLLVGLDQKGKVLARAVYWPDIHNRNTGETATYIDRIYHAGNYNIKDQFINYCEDQGWKMHCNSYPSSSWYYEGPEPNENSCPYHDTFIFYDADEGRYIPYEGEHGYHLCNTDGTATFVDDRVPMVTLYNGDEAPETDVCFVRRYGDYYLIEECVFSRYERSYIPEVEAVYVDGAYYYEDDEEIVEDVYDGRTLHTSDAARLSDGSGYTAWRNAKVCPMTQEVVLRDNAYYDDASGIYFKDEAAKNEYFRYVTSPVTVENLAPRF